MSSARLFVLNFVQFLLIAANMRAIAQGQYLAAFVSDALICFVGVTITKRIVAATSWSDKVSYAMGGAVGAQAAIYITTLMFGS